MNMPPFDLTHVANEDGTPHPKFKQLMDMLITNFNNNLSNNGYIQPHQATEIITQLNTPASIGATIYNSTTHKLMVCENGVFKTVTTT